MNIVLIADRTFQSYTEVDINGNQLEMISDEYFNEVFSGLKLNYKQVIHYQSPQELSRNAHLHKNDLVFTIFGGRGSRNRMSLVPAICEANNIKFVGADVYGRIMCQDKQLAKQIVSRYQIPTPQSVFLDENSDFSIVRKLNYPLVVKPNFEGSSIGICDNSKVNTYEEALIVINDLLEKEFTSIIVEEFIPGREICICVIGNSQKIIALEAMEVFFEEDENYFHERLNTAKAKHLSEYTVSHRPVTHLLNKKEIKNIISLFIGLGKMDFMRIDGRINSNGFFLIELTPDGYVGQDSSFADMFATKGRTYDDLLKQIIDTTLEEYNLKKAFKSKISKMPQLSY